MKNWNTHIHTLISNKWIFKSHLFWNYFYIFEQCKSESLNNITNIRYILILHQAQTIKSVSKNSNKINNWYKIGKDERIFQIKNFQIQYYPMNIYLKNCNLVKEKYWFICSFISYYPFLHLNHNFFSIEIGTLRNGKPNYSYLYNPYDVIIYLGITRVETILSTYSTKVRIEKLIDEI